MAGGIDLKGQITKILEELIEKHPETLDAIENVRMNRLFQLGAHQKEQNQSDEDTIEQKHHLAADTSDTSKGAIHAFQDEHGNWFTYCFDPQSIFPILLKGF